MSLLVALALTAALWYFLNRRTLGPDKPTVMEDIRRLFRRGEPKSYHEPASDEDSRQRTEIIHRQHDGSFEADASLSDDERFDEIIGLQELWDVSSDAEAKAKDENRDDR